MSADRRFVVARDDQDAAYELMFRLARVLSAAGAAERYGLSVRRIRAGRDEGDGWGVYLTDRSPGQAPPEVLTTGYFAESLPRTA